MAGVERDARHKKADEATSEEKGPNPCEACGADTGWLMSGGRGGFVWDKRLCHPCIDLWHKAAPSYGDLEKRGVTDTLGYFREFTEGFTRTRGNPKGQPPERPELLQERAITPPKSQPDLGAIARQNGWKDAQA